MRFGYWRDLGFRRPRNAFRGIRQKRFFVFAAGSGSGNSAPSRPSDRTRGNSVSAASAGARRGRRGGRVECQRGWLSSLGGSVRIILPRRIDPGSVKSGLLLSGVFTPGPAVGPRIRRTLFSATPDPIAEILPRVRREEAIDQRISRRI